MTVCCCVSVLLLDRAWVCSPDHSKASLLMLCCDEGEYSELFFFLIKIYVFVLAVLGLRCSAWAFSSCFQWGLLFVAECRFLIVVASAVVESVGSRARWPRCSTWAQ